MSESITIVFLGVRDFRRVGVTAFAGLLGVVTGLLVTFDLTPNKNLVLRVDGM